MTRLPDPSGDLSALWPLWVWLLLAAVALTIALIPLIARSAVETPQAAAGRVREWWDREGVDLDAMDGVVTCHLRCSLPGTITRVTRADLGLEAVRVCPGHSDEGDRADRGWWVA